VIDPAFFSAFAALAGSAIGGMTSLGAAWLSQRVQFRAQQYARDISRRDDLYKSFIEEASRLYADAYEHDGAKISNLVNLYALVSRMRVISSPTIVKSADEVARVIIETYRAPNKTLGDLAELLDDAAVNPLRDFSDACREELRRAASLPGQ
jgi:hypothetical protein